MAMRLPHLAALAALPVLLPAGARGQSPAGTRFAVSFPAARSAAPLDGRVLLLLSVDSTAEPRFQISDAGSTQLVFGIDVDGLRPGQDALVDARVFGYPLESLSRVPAGRYRVQAVLNRYETFRRSDGRVVKLPPDRGEGQQWNRKPGNLYSVPLAGGRSDRRTYATWISGSVRVHAGSTGCHGGVSAGAARWRAGAGSGARRAGDARRRGSAGHPRARLSRAGALTPSYGRMKRV